MSKKDLCYSLKTDHHVWDHRGLYAVCLVVLCGLLYFHYQALERVWMFTTDDAYISFRYARHLAKYKALVWNVGETVPVEGYSNFLWVLIAAIFDSISNDSVPWMKGLGAACALGTVVLSFLVTSRLTNPLVGLLPPAFLLVFTGFHYWAISGMETSMFAFLVAFSMLQAVDLYERGGESVLRWTMLAVTYTLIALIHLEGLIFGATAVAWWLVFLWRRGERSLLSWQTWRDPEFRKQAHVRGFLTFLLVFGGLLVTYQVWHLWYYKQLLPNTFFCKASAKASGFGKPQLLVKMLYTSVGLFVGIALLGLRERDFFCMHSLTLTALYVALLWDKDPIIAQFNRHIMAIFVYLLIVGVVQLWLLCREIAGQAHVRVGGTLFMGAGTLLFVMFFSHQELAKAERWAKSYTKRSGLRQRVGEWLKKRVKANEYVVVGDCGLIPYAFEGKVIDIYCLNNVKFVHKFKRHSDRYTEHLMTEVKPAWLVIRRDRHIVPFGISNRILRHREFSHYRRLVGLKAARGHTYYEIFQRSENRVAFDFLNQLPFAKVRFDYRDKPLQPPFANGRFQGRKKWETVRRHRLPISHAQPDCIWSHPLQELRKLTIAYPKVPMKRRLVLELGVPKGGKRQPGLQFLVQWAGRQRRLSFPFQVGVWKRYIFPLKEGPPAPVQVAIYGPKVGRAWVCWRAWVER